MHPGALHPVHHPVHPVKAVAVAVAVATLELTHHPGTRAAPRQTSCREERYMSPDRRTTGYVAEAAARAAAEPERSVLTPQVDPSVTATPAAPGAPVPDLGRTSEAIGRPASRSVQVTILTALAVLYTLYFARPFFVPIAFALLLNFLLSPAIRGLARYHIRPPHGAAIVVFLLLTGLIGGTYALSGPAQRWATSAPESLSKAEGKLREVVVREGPTLSSRLLGTTERLAAGLLEVIVLLYFLLAGGDLFLQKLIKVLPNPDDRAKVVEVARSTEAAVSAYLTTALVVNLTEGAVVTLVLWMLGMPSAPFWGALVVFLEFVPYLGAATLVVVLGIAGLATFDNVGRALNMPASFLAINLIQANVVTPLLLGHRLTLNPVAIFVGLTFFFFIWGVAGAFLAVPLLASLKIICDNTASLAALGEFLGQRDETERRELAR